MTLWSFLYYNAENRIFKKKYFPIELEWFLICVHFALTGNRSTFILYSRRHIPIHFIYIFYLFYAFEGRSSSVWDSEEPSSYLVHLFCIFKIISLISQALLKYKIIPGSSSVWRSRTIDFKNKTLIKFSYFIRYIQWETW